MRHDIGKFFFAIFTFVSFSIAALAQGGTATLTGRVTDPDGLAVWGAKIQATNANTGAVYSADTSEAGLYSVTALPPGTYKIVAEKAGFGQVVKPLVELHVADVVAVNFALKIGSESQSITVNGGAPLVNTTTSSLGGLVNSEKVADLPLNGRNYVALTLLQPGISQNPNINSTGSSSGTWFSSNGAPLRSNNYTLDGAILQNINAGSTASLSGTTLGLDGILEYRVITSAFPAEYGMSMGSQTIIVSKSGTNQFHGTAFEYLRNSAMDAANYFDHGVAVNNFQRLPPFRRNNFGGSFGGPIKKDKTFIFGTYEGLRERLGITNIANVIGAGCHGPAGAVITVAACPQLAATPSVTVGSAIAPILALFPTPNLANNQFTFPYSQPNRDDYVQVRADQAISDRDSLFGRYTFEDDTQIPGLPYPQFTNPRLSRSQYATLSETHAFHGSLLNTFRFSYSRTSSQRTSPDDLAGTTTSFLPGLPVANYTIGGITVFGPQQSKEIPSIQNQDIFSLNEDLAYATGRHSFKFGVQVNRYLYYFQNPNRLGGTITFASVATFLRGQQTNFSVSTPGSLLDRTYRFFPMGFYAQDDWKVRPNLTVNAGLRYEPTTQITEVHGHGSALINPLTDAAFTVGIPYLNPTKDNFSPRLGFAWDVWGNGTMAVRGGAAILYDIANLGNALINQSPSQPPFTSTTTVTGGAPLTIPVTIPASAAASNTAITMQYHFQQPRVYTENLSVEQQLPGQMVLSIAYSGSRGLHLTNASEGNPNIATVGANGQQVWASNTTRINPKFGSVAVWSSQADSTYHSLQVSVIKRVTKGLQFQSSYTWSKLIDNGESLGQGDTTVVNIFDSNPYNSRFDRGSAYFDMTHNWVFNGTYTLPSPHFDGVFGGFTRGWAASAILNIHSGLPFHPTVVTQRSRSGVSAGTNIDRPNWNPAFTGDVITGNPNQYFNPAAFVLEPVGSLGNVGRDSLRGPGLQDLDFSLRKDTKLHFLGEGGNVQFRVDAFNILNHPNFGQPSTSLFSGALANTTEAPLSSAGVISTTVTPSRQIQLSLRLSF